MVRCLRKVEMTKQSYIHTADDGYVYEQRERVIAIVREQEEKVYCVLFYIKVTKSRERRHCAPISIQ